MTLKRTHLTGYVLIIIQTILIILTALTFLSDRYEAKWHDYLNDQTSYSIYLNNIPTDKKDEVIDYLTSEAEKDNFLLLKKDNIENSFSLGVAGNSSKIEDNFAFYGHSILQSNSLTKLLHSNNENATLGLGRGSIDQLTSIYKFPFSDQVVIYKLDKFNRLDKTISGKYQLVGLSSNRTYNSIIKHLAKITALGRSDFTSARSGSAQDNTLTTGFLIAGILVTSLGIFAYFFIYLLSSLKEFGTLVLLGWSKKTILYERFKPFLKFTIFWGIISSIVLSIYFGRISFLVLFILFFILAALINIIILTFIYLVASLLIISLKNISLIKGHYPKAILYSFITMFYLLISGVLLTVSIYIDGPAKSIVANTQQAMQWHKVEKMAILNKFEPGEDGVQAFGDPSSSLYQDTLNFYKNIADKDGVYYISSFYGSKDWLANGALYKKMPTKPFTILTASPNYLKKIKFPLSSSALQKAKRGIRVFYLPDTYSAIKQKNFKIFLKDLSTDGIQKNDIQTTFSKKQQIAIKTYHPDKNIFLWNNDSTEPANGKAPIIDILTPANMTYETIGNIQSSGLENPLKFQSEKVAKQVLNTKRLQKYHLDDNKLTYTTVSNYIDGEQKSLWETITLFAIVLFFLIGILCLLIIVLAMAYKTINQQQIAVKKFLGFNFRQIYGLPLSLIAITSLIEMIIILIARSKIGILIILITFLVELIVFYIYISRGQFSDIINQFKED
ncbi:hypothetical protein J2Z60_001523 [Lactobacillus colini]|uniref:Uncharacterized protein n=1 Tax=Lactobacillus colini TaxID=1819254 RepID=A0ABS4MF84_9LACO|nr:hypothetical protein [Lactobacillus colini]MBP2058344.1 hypothetical protein [Lactobacillus colini]